MEETIDTRNPRLSLHFINVSGPVDSAASDRLRQIRSHVAKNIHARAKHERLVRLRRQPDDTTQDLTIGEDENEAKLRSQETLSAQLDAANTSRANTQLRRIAPKLRPNYNRGANPKEPLGSGRKDPFNSFVRSVTEVEQFLVDHYISFVVKNGYEHCEHEDAIFFSGMQSHYVPFSLGEAGMLSTILLTACRSLIRLDHKGYDYNRMALLYKGDCIKKANDALSHEGQAISDATIGIVLSMAADDFHVGNTSGYCIHADALKRMVDIRGGLGSTGVACFLGHLLRWSVYNPKWRNMVLKPDRSGKLLAHSLNHVE